MKILMLSTAQNLNLDNINENDNGIARPNGWPSQSAYPDRWLHSDMKDVSYFFNFMFFRKVIEKGTLQ